VRDAAGEDAQLHAQGRRGALEGVEAAARLAAAVGRAAQGAQAGVVAGAAVVERRPGHVANAPARGREARLPLLLVAVELARRVERPGTLDRTAAHGHVRAPRVVAVAVGRPEVQEGHRRSLAPARAQAMVLEARMDGAGEDADVVRAVGRRAHERVEPARAHLDVVVDEAHEL